LVSLKPFISPQIEKINTLFSEGVCETKKY